MKHRKHLFLFIGIILSLILVFNTSSQAAPAPSPAQELQNAWRRAQEAGAYHFATEIVQTTYPAPALVNVGRSSRQDTLHIEGQTNVPDRTLVMTLWKGGGSVLTRRDGVEVRVEGDRAYGRPIGGTWQEIDDFTDAFAPDSDLLAYLAGATNVRELGTETRLLPSPADGGETSIAFTRYSYDLDGPAFAGYLRRQLEDYLRENGGLPAGLTLGVSDQFRQVTGQGEVWIDEQGLPLRLTVHLAYPPQRNGERVEADIQTDFWNFAPLPETRNPLTRLAGALGLPRSPRDWGRAVQQGSMAVAMAGLLVLLMAHRRSRQVYVTFVLVILLSTVVGPLLQSHQVYAFSQRMAAEREAQEQRQEEARAEEEALDAFLTSDWDPHRDPLEVHPADQQAINLLKDGRYEEAIAAFQKFLVRYPKGQFADNAQYWLAEANYVLRHFPTAIEEFNKVLVNYPDSQKIADAMLKIGYCYYELKKWQQARKILEELVKRFPDSTAAQLAKNRLHRMKLEGR